MTSYSPQLNVRSAYNFQQSLITIDDYLEFAAKHNFAFAFYADLNSMYGVAEFFDKFEKKNIKPIIGLTLEFYLDQKITLNLYAKNRSGYRSLCYISSEIQTKNLDQNQILMFSKQYFTNDLVYVVTFEESFNHSFYENLCLNLDKNNFFIGMTQKNQDLIDAENVVYTNEICYFNEKDFQAYKTLIAAKNNQFLDEINDLKASNYLADDFLINNDKSQANLKKIVSMINFQFFDNKEIHLMNYLTPNNLPQFQFLKEISYDALNSYLNFYHIKHEIHKKYQDRLNYELEIIHKMGFVNYFLIVRDYVRFAKDNDIMVGPGRGSAAGSLVSFLLRITTVDPLKYDLLFERFLNPERKTMPDIDIDFQDNRREEVIEYLFEKYGAYHVGTIVTYQTIGAKSALRDVIRASNQPVELANKITKLIPFQFQDNLSLAIENSKLLAKYSNDYPEIFETALKFVGLPRQTGTHAAGIVISDVDLREVVPIRIGYNGVMQTQIDMNYLERLGLIKMDLLGLRNLTTLQEISNNIFRAEKKEINFDKLNLDDQNVYNLLSSGKTSGIFQLESPGMTKLIIQMQPKNIEDISTTSAIFRPGPKEMIPEYLKRRNQKRNINNYIIDKSLTDILAPTYGIILYQEQVIQVLQKVANFSLAKADIVRRSMSKKNFSYMELVKDEFLQNAINNGYSQDKVQEIWNWIDHFASYGFNKSHSIAYSYISYWLAWLKTYYPEHFYTSMFNSCLGNGLKTSNYVKEVSTYGINFHGPRINSVNGKYVSYNKIIFAPLILIKGIGPEFLKKIQVLWKENKDLFRNFYLLISNLVDKGLNATTFEALIWSGAFDNFDLKRSLLINNLDLLLNFAETNKNLNAIDPLTIPDLVDDPLIDERKLSEKEYEYLGFYLSKNPFSIKRQEYVQNNVLTLEKIRDEVNHGTAIVQINSIRTKRDKNGQLMAFLDIDDDTANLKATMFASTFEKVKDSLNTGAMVIARIRVQDYNNEKSAVVNEIIMHLN